MKIALIGATGMVGSRIRDEALRRGHMVTGIARHAGTIPRHKNLTILEINAENTPKLTETIKGHDVVILAVKYDKIDGRQLLEAIRKAGLKRVAIVGGAGSLETAPGKLLLEDPAMPATAIPQAKASAEILRILRLSKDLDWTYISPSAYFFDGEAQGKVRFGRDQLLKDKEGRSSISTGDYAVAMLDEIENPKHLKERITVGY